ncbi:flagellar hook-associated protein 2 [Marmoricola sp. OAE513]|uniref:flagellar filament capping protein FliD n=1 Tax=Marmoricola sp. OAE513 TaxID=2817894 RepID=UPI001AE35071
MASTASVSGLASGLDTSTIISQLMKVEAQTQTNIKAKLAGEQSNVKSLQDLNTAFAALATSAADLAKATAWNPVKVTSSSTLVTATAGTSAVPGPLNLTVGHTALSHRLTFAGTAALTAPVTTGSNSVRIDHLDGTTQDIDTGDGTLAGLVRGINASGTGLKASTVRLDDGSYRLQVVSTATGEDADFTLTNLDGSDLLGGATVRAGRDAEITIGADTVHSATNTFTDVANGLSITLAATVADGTTVDLDVTQDTAGMTAKVKSIVDSINAALSKIDALTGYNATTKTSGALAGDGSVRALRNSLLNAIYPADGSSMVGVGIQLDRYGKLVFDADKFTAAYAADPSAVAARFTTGSPTTGFAARVQAVAKGASDSVDGSITTSISGRNTSIRRMQDSIDDWDTRLALRQDTLTKQFTAMESALQQMNAQSSWLTSQLGSLSNSS